MSNQEQLAATLLTERLIPVYDVPALVPPARSGRQLHRAAVWRWVAKGLPGRDGGRVHLEAVRIGRRWVTSHEAVARFVARTTRSAPTGDQPRHAAIARPALRPSTLATLARHGISLAPAAAS